MKGMELEGNIVMRINESKEKKDDHGCPELGPGDSCSLSVAVTMEEFKVQGLLAVGNVVASTW